ncbi:MAG: bacteriocin family protein [Deltaproteobacteria bacterium]|nr:bacteriocin family protein [Deltaproteobacteria bacterium]
MTSQYLHREDAPFGKDLWHRLDSIVVEAAKSRLSGRRLLHVEEPYGIDLKALPGNDAPVREKTKVGSSTTQVSISSVIPVPVIRTTFRLGSRDIQHFEKTGIQFAPGAITEAAMACARQEDSLIFNGSPAVGLEGLLNAKGTCAVKLTSWQTVGAAADNLIQAVTTLDDAGFPGPYSLALAPGLYNLLLRRYPQGNMLEIEHIKNIVTEGVIKAPCLSKGGVLLASGKHVASIIIGQDLMAGFIGPDEGDYVFSLSESLVPVVRQPKGICVLNP